MILILISYKSLLLILIWILYRLITLILISYKSLLLPYDTNTHIDRKIPQNKPDFVIINDKETDEGLCHGAILAGHSPELAKLVENSKEVCLSLNSILAGHSPELAKLVENSKEVCLLLNS
jgi:hypothetical protein